MPQSGHHHRDDNHFKSDDAEEPDVLMRANTGKRSRAPAESLIIALLLIICCFAFASNLLR